MKAHLRHGKCLNSYISNWYLFLFKIERGCLLIHIFEFNEVYHRAVHFYQWRLALHWRKISIDAQLDLKKKYFPWYWWFYFWCLLYSITRDMIISEYCLNLALAVHIFVFVKLAESVINHSGFSSPENGLKIPGKLSAMMIKQE